MSNLLESRSRARVWLALLAALTAVSPQTGFGQDVPTLDPDQVLDYRWLYSHPDDGIVFTALDLGAQNTNLISIPISIWLRRVPCCGNPPNPKVDGNTFGIRLRITPVIGLAQFDSISDFDIRSATLGAVFPGFEFVFKTGQLSMLRPYIDIGYASTASDSTSLWYGELGLRTEFVFPWKRWELGLEPRMRGGYSFTDIENADLGQVTVSSKVDARYPLGFTIEGYTPDIGAYFEPSWSPNPVTFIASDGTEQSVRWQFEVGGTVGFRYLAPMFCDLFRWMRLGVGYRFGEGTSGWHIRIGGDRLTRLPLP